jgi:hypothetical protein
MCLWFVVSFYDDYVPFVLVETGSDGQRTQPANPSQTLGLNNDNTLQIETIEGGADAEKRIIEGTSLHPFSNIVVFIWRIFSDFFFLLFRPTAKSAI